MKGNHKIGLYGETIAKNWLEAHGYQVMMENFRYKRSEIDLIAIDQGVMVFIEVKTRKSVRFGFPEMAVNEAKMEKVKEGAEAYLNEIGWEGGVRFDVVSILLYPEIELKHFKDAF